MENRKENKKYEEQFWNKYNEKINSDTAMFLIVSCIGILGYSVWDRISLPNYWFNFFIYRLLLSITGIILVILTKKKIIKGFTANLIFLTGTYIFLTYGASLINADTVLLIWNMSASIAGFLWVAAIMTFPPNVAIFFSSFYFVLSIAFSWINNPIMLTKLPQNGGIFILCILVMIPFAHAKRYRDLKRIFFLETEIEEKQKEIEYQASYDHLTGAFSRRAGIGRLEDRINLSKREKVNLSLCYIDVDNLKVTNDKLGHKEGDALIKTICDSIFSFIRNTDIFCRVGGDEFFIIFHNVNQEQANHVMKRIEEDLLRKSSNYNFPLEMSFGIVEYDLFGNESVELFIERADKTMYEIKKRKKNINQKN